MAKHKVHMEQYIYNAVTLHILVYSSFNSISIYFNWNCIFQTVLEDGRIYWKN